ncbi:MAG: hypothetical protein M3323_06785 [Actinomycetota bacterium]|nr:hypothetical protein [Actinomycetota bacterium]
MRRRALPLLLAAGLFVGTTGTACDKEDRRDAQEVGDDLEKGIDKLDSDGKDD